MTQNSNFPLLAARDCVVRGNDTAVHHVSRLAARHTSAAASRSAVTLTVAHTRGNTRGQTLK